MPPQPKPKSNLLAFIKRFRKPTTPMEIILMTLKMNELLPFIKDLITDFLAAKSRIAELESGNRSLAARIADLENERSAEVALMEEAKVLIVNVRDVGGSVGGVV